MKGFYMEDYKSNSHRSKVNEKKVEKIVKGTVKTKPKSEAKKVANIFLSEDARNVKSYIVGDILIPAIKKTFSDMINSGTRMLLYGEHYRPDSNDNKPSYWKCYDKPKERPYQSNTMRSVYDYEDISFDNRGEAEEVLATLEDLIYKYEVASVADYKDLVGITGKYTDNKYGWTDLRMASVIRGRDSYELKLPRVTPL